MDFALERARTLTPDSDSEEYLLEIAWLYNRVVLTGSQIPVIDLAYELVLPEEFIGECVSTAMDSKIIHASECKYFFLASVLSVIGFKFKYRAAKMMKCPIKLS